FGDTTATAAERFLGTDATSTGRCIGCHALSRDGKKMVLKTDNAAVLLYDVEHRKPLAPYPLAQDDNFESWNPDGSHFVGVYGDGMIRDLMLFDGNTGVVAGTIPLGGVQADHPDWSADGVWIFFIEVGVVHTDQTPERGGISYVEKVGSE